MDSMVSLFGTSFTWAMGNWEETLLFPFPDIIDTKPNTVCLRTGFSGSGVGGSIPMSWRFVHLVALAKTKLEVDVAQAADRPGVVAQRVENAGGRVGG